MKVGSLFAGIGGFDLAARWMGWKTAWYSEIDPYASAVMHKHFPSARNHGDITKIDGHAIEHVDLLCGGFPCQDISLAGKGAGLAGERSGLWSHYARLIDEIRPSWVVIENVSALRSRGLDVVLGEIAALGYNAEWHCIPASAVGAPHRRDRVWIVAHSERVQLRLESGRGSGARRAYSPLFAVDGEARNVADAASQPESEQGHETEALSDSGDARLVASGSCAGLAVGRAAQTAAVANDAGLEGRNSEVVCERTGEQLARAGSASAPDERQPDVHSGWLVEPNVGRVANGVPSRVDRLKCLGNAIVPQVAYEIFQAIERSRTVVAA